MNNILKSLIFLIFISACRNETSLSIQSAKDYLLITKDICSVVPIVVNVSKDPIYLKTLLNKHSDSSNTCATFRYINGDTANMLGVVEFEIDFYQGCTDKDGLNKAGIIKCELHNSLNTINACCKLSFDGFQIANDFLWGGMTIENKDVNKWKVVTEELLLQSGKEYIFFVDTLLFEKIAGIATYSFKDDEFIISSKGELNSNVSGYSNNLCKKYNCSWLSKGILELNIYDYSKQIINLGSNECDNEATLQIGEEEYFLEMQ